MNPGPRSAAASAGSKTAGTRLRAAIPYLSSAPSGSFCLVLFALYAAYVAAGLALHAMWLDEVQAWLIVRDSPTFAALLKNLSYEGHPLGWYLLLWPLTALGRAPNWMQLAQGACALGAMALLIWRGPFSRPELILMALSYPFVFEYAVKSRSYALGNLLLFAFCASFVARRPLLLLAGLLGLMVNVHALFGLIALGGAAALAVQRVGAEGWGRVVKRSDLPAIVIFALAGALAVIVTRQPADSGFAVGWAFDLRYRHLVETSRTLGALVAGPTAPDALLVLSPFLGIAVWGLLLARARRAPVAAVFFAVAAGLLLLFLHVKIQPHPWHESLMFVVLVAAVWLARGDKGPLGPALLPRGLFAAVLGLQAMTGAAALVREWREPYSAGRETAWRLIEAGLGSAPLFAFHGPPTTSVVAYLGAPSAFYGNGMRQGSFNIWDRAARVPPDIPAVVDRAQQARDPVILDCSLFPPDALPPDPRLVEWGRVSATMEKCVIYRLAPSPPPVSPAGR